LEQAGLDSASKNWELSSLTIAALHFNPDLQIARAKLLPLRAAIETAGEAPNPSISWSPQYSTDPSGVPPWTLGFTFDIPIETAKKRELREKAARASLRPSELSVLQTAWGVRMKVREALLQCKQAQDLEQILRSEQQLLSTNRVLYAPYAERGQVPEVVVLDAKRKEQSNRLELEDSHLRQIQCRDTLAAAIGVSPEVLRVLPIGFRALEHLPTFTSQQALELQDRALQTRSDVQGALADYQVAEAALELEIAKQYPDIQLSPGYSYDQGEHKWGLGLGLTLPVFNQNRGPIHEAEAKREELAVTFSSLQARAIGELQSRFDAYKQLVTTVAVAEQNLAVQKQYVNWLRDRLKVGELAKPLLLTAELDVIAARKALTESSYRAQLQLGLLEDALQSSFSDSFDSTISQRAAET